MRADGRLGRLYPALSARERAALVLRAWKEGREEEPELRATLPPGQAEEFHRLVALLHATNGTLAGAVAVLGERLRLLRAAWGWRLTLSLWLDEGPRCAPRLEGLAGKLGELLRRELAAAFGELEALDRALEEVRDAVGDEDPVLPEARERLEAVRAGLLSLRDEVAPLAGPVELAEPDEALRALLREALGLPAG